MIDEGTCAECGSSDWVSLGEYEVGCRDCALPRSRIEAGRSGRREREMSDDTKAAERRLTNQTNPSQPTIDDDPEVVTARRPLEGGGHEWIHVRVEAARRAELAAAVAPVSAPQGGPAGPGPMLVRLTTEQNEAVTAALVESVEPGGFLGFDAWWAASEDSLGDSWAEDVARAAWDAALDYAATLPITRKGGLSHG